MTHPAALPHEPLEEIGDDVFMVRGCARLNPVMSISRNMAVLRDGESLTLVDPMRLDEREEARLLELGSVDRILRLGPMHGVDDAYYVDRFGAKICAPGPSEAYPEPKVDEVWTEADALPMRGTRLFVMAGTVQPEAALIVERGRPLLITCDAIQHYGDYSHNNLPARLMMPFIGFPKKTIVGPIWLKLMTPEGGNLESEFRRLLTFPFDDLLSAHGTLLQHDAKASVTAAVDRAFPAG